jgi:hypothetical protein
MIARIERSPDGATARVLLHHPGHSVVTTKVTWTDWDALVACLDGASFWSARSHAVHPGADGDHPILEAVIAGRYNAVMHGSFSEPPEPAWLECLRQVERIVAPAEEAARAEVLRATRLTAHP